MNNKKSYEYNFIYLINKCLLLFKYININSQQEILNEIKNFINKLQEMFSTFDFKNNIDKKNKILEILIHYFEKLINEKIYNLINYTNKNYLINEIEKIAHLACENTDKKNDAFNFAEKILEQTTTPTTTQTTTINSTTITSAHSPIVQQPYKETVTKQKQSILKENIMQQNIINNEIEELEKRFNVKMKTVFSEIESNIKNSLKDYLDHTQYVEYNLDKKFNQKIETNNLVIENKLKTIVNECIGLQNKSLQTQLNNLMTYKNEPFDIETIKNLINEDNIKNNVCYELKEKINDEIDDKIKVLAQLFNDNIQNLINNLNTRISNNEEDLIKIIEDKINNSNFNKNNFNIFFDKDNNEIKLLYGNDIITTTKINIKGLIGPKGPIGNKGETPIIRKIQFTNDKKMKMIVQESNNLYEVFSDDVIPNGPPGPPGERGEPGKCIMDLKWNQDNVMRIDEDNNDSLIFLKSLCVGEKSHCLKDNSLSIGGGICYHNNSVAIGNNSKTLDSESIALYGSTIGKRAFAYRSNNVDENTVQFGIKEKMNYNINGFNINAKEITLDCNTLKIKTNKYENNKILELEEKIINLEKKMVDILRKI